MTWLTLRFWLAVFRLRNNWDVLRGPVLFLGVLLVTGLVLLLLEVTR